MKTCPECLSECEALTRDHICPKWFLKACESFGISLASPRIYVKIYNKPLNNIRKICGFCNYRKGGKLDLNDQYTKDLILLLKDKLEIYIPTNK